MDNEFTTSDAAYVRSRLLNNELVLFVGAGFSRCAKNARGNTIPTSEELSEVLWPHLSSDPFDRYTSLPEVFQSALAWSEKSLSAILLENFTCREVPDWYSTVARIPWRRIYTTNIDDLVECIYRRTPGAPRLRVIDGVHDDYEDLDPTLESIQLIKLNGRDLTDPRSLTFTDESYGKRAAENHVWYDHLVRDYCTKAIIIVGSRLKESPFYASLAERGKRIPKAEARPRSFLIQPSLNSIQLKAWKEYNIKGISAKAEPFFEDLESKILPIPSRYDIIANVLHDTDVGKFLEQKAEERGQAVARSIQRFFEGFQRVMPARKSSKPPGKYFLLGAEPTFTDLEAELDAPRVITNEIIHLLTSTTEKETPVPVIITGYAGSGKTTLLQRIALELRKQGQLVFYSDSTEAVDVESVRTTVSEFNESVYLIIDNANLLGRKLADYLCLSLELQRQPRFLIALRSNRSSVLQYLDDASVRYFQQSMPDLCDRDIRALIGKLDEFGLLGVLTGKSIHEQLDAFRVHAKRQLLVAMMSATLGRDFNRYIEDEYTTIENLEVRIVYLIVSLATSEGYTVRWDQLVASTDLSAAELKNEFDSSLKGLVFSAGSKNDYYKSRHRVVAEQIIETIADRTELGEAYKRLLRTLAHDLTTSRKINNRVSSLYQTLIYHGAIFRRFKRDIITARSIYGSLEGVLSSDYHFWLQYGSLEIHYDELDTAENYLAQARSLRAVDDYVATTFALLYYRRACKTSRHSEAFSYREKALDELHKQFKYRPSDDFPVVLYLHEERNWINTWPSNLEQKLGFMRELKKNADVFVQKHRNSSAIREERTQIERNLLDLAVPDESFNS